MIAADCGAVVLGKRDFCFFALHSEHVSDDFLTRGSFSMVQPLLIGAYPQFTFYLLYALIEDAGVKVATTKTHITGSCLDDQIVIFDESDGHVKCAATKVKDKDYFLIVIFSILVDL